MHNTNDTGGIIVLTGKHCGVHVKRLQPLLRLGAAGEGEEQEVAGGRGGGGAAHRTDGRKEN